MRASKLGEVYCIKVPNGYKLVQWAYRIPKYGDYIRVFDGLYEEIPHDIKKIVYSKHSYITAFHVSKAYRIGLAQWIGNFEVPKEYPLPEFGLRFKIDFCTHITESILVANSPLSSHHRERYYVASVCDLPKEYRDITLVSGYVTPDWLLYWFDTGFDLQHPEKYFPGPNSEAVMQKYSDIINLFINGRTN